MLHHLFFNFIISFQEERNKLHSNARKIKDALKARNIPVIPNISHIIPVLIGDAKKCKIASDTLLKKYNIYIQPINYPTVPRGEELLRVSPTPNHNEKLINELVVALDEVFESLDIKRLSDWIKEDHSLFKK